MRLTTKQRNLDDEGKKECVCVSSDKLVQRLVVVVVVLWVQTLLTNVFGNLDLNFLFIIYIICKKESKRCRKRERSYGQCDNKYVWACVLTQSRHSL